MTPTTTGAQVLFLPTTSPTTTLVEPFHATQQHDLTAAWLRWLAEQVDLGQLAADTVTTYRRGLVAWLAFLDRVARTDQPTPATVAAYLTAIIPTRQPGTVNLHLAALRSVYRWAEAGDRYPDIARSARPLRVSRDGPLPSLSHAEVAALVAGVTGADLKSFRDRALLATLYGTACRTISLARARVGDLDLVAGTLRHHPKGHRAADVLAYLPAGASKVLAEYLATRYRGQACDPREPLFIALDRRRRGAALSTYSMRAVVRAAMERAGHARRGPDGRLVAPGVWSAHSLRRSSLTTAADAFGLEAARAVAGHSSVEITRRVYVRAKLDGQMRQVAAVLDLGAVVGSSVS